MVADVCSAGQRKYMWRTDSKYGMEADKQRQGRGQMYTGLRFGRDTQNAVKTWVHRTEWGQMFT